MRDYEWLNVADNWANNGFLLASFTLSILNHGWWFYWKKSYFSDMKKVIVTFFSVTTLSLVCDSVTDVICNREDGWRTRHCLLNSAELSASEYKRWGYVIFNSSLCHSLYHQRQVYVSSYDDMKEEKREHKVKVSWRLLAEMKIFYNFFTFYFSPRFYKQWSVVECQSRVEWMLMIYQWARMMIKSLIAWWIFYLEWNEIEISFSIKLLFTLMMGDANFS